MPTTIDDLRHRAESAGVSRADLFLLVQAARNGKLKGEATTEGHVDDIELLGWTWGAQAGSALGSGTATARRAYRPLVVQKGVDAASVPLLKVLASNDEVREATLTMRKAGGEALDYFRMTLAGARVTDIVVEVDARGRPIEQVTITYTKIDVEYRRQAQAGGGGGAITFTDEVLPSA